MMTYSMISAYYALVLGNGHFPNLLFHQILLFRLYLIQCVNKLVIKWQKYTFTKFKASFSGNLRMFDLESHIHTSVKVKLVKSGLVYMKLRKLKSPYQENKKLNLHKKKYFYCWNHSIFYGRFQFYKSFFKKI